MKVSIIKHIPKLDCILHYIRCPESVQVFLLLLKSVRVLLLILTGSGFHCGFPLFSWVREGPVLSLWGNTGNNSQAKCLGFALFNLKVFMYLQSTLLWSNVNVHVLAVSVLKSCAALSRTLGGSIQHRLNAVAALVILVTEETKRQLGTAESCREETEQKCVLSKHEMLKFQYVLKEVSENVIKISSCIYKSCLLFL